MCGGDLAQGRGCVSSTVFAVIIVVLGFAAGVLANWFVRPVWLKTGALVVVILVTLGALALVTIIKDSHDGEQSAGQQGGGRVTTTTASAPDSGTTAALPTTTPTTTRPAPSTTTAKSADKPSANTETQMELRYLTDIGPIGGYGNNEGAGVATMGGVAFTESITFAPGTFNKTVKDLSFNIPAGLGMFKATVGLGDKSLPDYVAQIDISRRDGSSIASKTLRAGETQRIDESVAGAGSITVKVTVTTWAADAINSRPQIVLGDGQFTRS
ncbi:MAG: hypothetical protein ABW224_07175 [Kibdelosporangium sp.]